MENNAYLTELPCRRLIDGCWQDGRISLVRECGLTVVANGVSLPAVMCSPVDLNDLILGLLITSRTVGSVDQILSIRIDETGMPTRITAAVTIRDSTSAKDAERTAANFEPDTGSRKCAAWDAGMIRRLSEYVVRDAEAHRGSHSTHSCTLMRGGEIIALREDIGRHNAIDRAVGWAAGNGVPIRECLAFFSGRISGTAIEKAAAAGITVLCGKALPTARAVRLAHDFGITLLHYSERRGCILF